MSRASFRRNINRHIHFADNLYLEQGNKIAKVAPVYTSVNATLAKFGAFHEDLSIDESMVPYFGRHSAKMFIRGKPIRFGYKLWSLCGSDGYPSHLQVYKGKEATSSKEPLGTRVVNHMVEVVRENSDVAKHHFFFEQLLHIPQAPSFPTWHPRKWKLLAQWGKTGQEEQTVIWRPTK